VVRDSRIRGEAQLKLTVLYTPQCPSNLYFVKTIKEWAAPHSVEVEAINVNEEDEKARLLMEHSGVGRVRNLFIRVYMDGEIIPTHPGNPNFFETLNGALEARK
jgi:NAD(P)H-flavin reductase